MVNDMLKLTIDLVFPPKKPYENINKFKVRGYNNNENMWEYLI